MADGLISRYCFPHQGTCRYLEWVTLGLPEHRGHCSGGPFISPILVGIGMDLNKLKNKDGGLLGDNRKVASRKKKGFAKPKGPVVSACGGGEESDCSVQSFSSGVSTVRALSLADRKQEMDELQKLIAAPPPGMAISEGFMERLFAAVDSRLATLNDVADSTASVSGTVESSRDGGGESDGSAMSVCSHPTEAAKSTAVEKRRRKPVKGASFTKANEKADRKKDDLNNRAIPRNPSNTRAEDGKAASKIVDQRMLVEERMERLERENAELQAQVLSLSLKVEELTKAIRQQAACTPATGGLDTATPGPSFEAPGIVKASCHPRQITKAQAPQVREAWSTVVKRGRKTNKVVTAQPTPKASPKAGLRPKPARLPNSAAITVTIPEGSDVTYAAVMMAAKTRIRLLDVGVEEIRPKRTITGGLMLEVSGPDCGLKADALAGRMREVLADVNVSIARPMKMGEMRIRDLDDSVTPEEVKVAVAKVGDCLAEDVRVGVINRSPTVLGTAWVRCPLAAVRKLAAAKHVTIGWLRARVEYLTPRPLQCFRCLEYGHVKRMCQSTADRSSLCYACGEPDHRASQCTRTHKCPLCSSMGCKADHRMGSKQCSPPNKGKRKLIPLAPTEAASGARQVLPQEAMDASA